MVWRQQITVQKTGGNNLLCLHGIFPRHQLEVALIQRMIRIQVRMPLARFRKLVITQVIDLSWLNVQRSIGDQAKTEGVHALQTKQRSAHGNVALSGAYLKPGEAVVANVEIVGVIYVDTGRFNFISRPLGVCPVEVQHRVAPIPAIVVDMNEVMPGNRMQERPDAFADGLINRTARQRQQQPHRCQKPGNKKNGRHSGFHCC